MIVLATGMRTDASPGWRAGVGVAFAVAVGDPRLWLLGALGFAARGGMILLALPILTVPSPIVLSTLFHGQLSTSGLAPGSEGLVAGLLASAGIVFALAVVGAAYADVAAFELMADDPDTEDLRADIAAKPFTRSQRLRSVVILATILVVALIPAAVVAALVVSRLETAFIQEWILPSSFDSPLVVRVASAVSEPLVALAVALLGGDLVYSLAGRAVLVATAGLGRDRPGRGAARQAISGALRVVTRPGRTFATALLAWPVTLVVLVPVFWAAGIAWNGVRTMFLSTSALTDAQVFPAAVTVIVIFAGIWVAATILAGFASAVRAALWSADALR